MPVSSDLSIHWPQCYKVKLVHLSYFFLFLNILEKKNLKEKFNRCVCYQNWLHL